MKFMSCLCTPNKHSVTKNLTGAKQESIYQVTTNTEVKTEKHRSRAYTQDESSSFLSQKSFKTSRAATWYHSCKFSHQSLKAELNVALSLQFVTQHFFSCHYNNVQC